MRALGLLILATGLCACTSKTVEHGLLVYVSNPANVTGIKQLRAFISDPTDPSKQASLSYPRSPAATDLRFDADGRASFSISLSPGRTGYVDLVVEALSDSGVLAYDTGSASLEADTFVPVYLWLRSGASLCGNGDSDVGETCDDGNQFSGDGCSYLCQREGSNPDAAPLIPQRPCDIYAAANTPCVAAHSTVRSLFGAYNGSLYQVRRASDNTVKDIAVIVPDGFANAASQDGFCKDTTCSITKLYDQSGHNNHLEYQGAGSGIGGEGSPANATAETVTVGGHKAYSLYLRPNTSYWADGSANGMPTGNAAETIYMVTSGVHVTDVCCFDYGNSETARSPGGPGAIDALYFGTICWWGTCSGTGPWVQADFEGGIYSGGSKTWNAAQVSLSEPFVTAMLKNDGTKTFALKGGNAQSGELTAVYEGQLPAGYGPMKKQGAITLGSGGDCCIGKLSGAEGTFYEGAIVSGYVTAATDDLVHANIVAAGYVSAGSL